MAYQKACIFPRFLAALIDGLIGWSIVFIPFIGGVLGFLYLLLRDGIIYELTRKEDWKNRSIGKKIMNLRVVRLEGGYVDLAVSAKRNISLTVGSLVAIIPLLGWLVGPVISLVLAVIELILLLFDGQGRRLGDRWADTQVVSAKTFGVVE